MKLSIRSIALWVTAAAVAAVVVLFGMTMTAYAQEYNLWVGGTQVTSENLKDIPAAKGYTKYSGKASFDPDTNTLTLDNYQYEGAGYSFDDTCGAIHSEIDLTIDLKGENKVIRKGEKCVQHIGISCSEFLTIQGNGSLETTTDCGTDESEGIFTDGITIQGNCKVTANGPSGDTDRSYGIVNFDFPTTIKGDCVVNATGGNCESEYNNTSSVGILTSKGINITGGRVKVASGEAMQRYGIHAAIGAITIAPEGDFIDVEASGDNAAIAGKVLNSIPGVGWTDDESDEVDISAVTDARWLNGYKKVRFGIYPLWVGGTKVTVKNLDDIPAAEGETRTGKASFDPYTDTLILEGYQYEGAGYDLCAIFSIFDLTIDLKGENKVIRKGEKRGPQHAGVFCNKALTIQGYGSLETGSDCGYYNSYGIFSGNDITIWGNCKVTADGASGDAQVSRGIGAIGSVVIEEGCTVVASGGDVTWHNETFSIGISGWEGVTITGGTVKATGGNADESSGIRANNGTISIDPGWALNVEASGNTEALNGNVLNKVAGTGWTNVQGEGTGEKIPAVTEARALDEKYKKVKFYYEPPKPAPKPKAKSVVAAPKKMKASGKKALVITWMKIKGAEGYDIFFNSCSKRKCKKIKTIKGNKKFSWKKTGLKTRKPYKSYVRAWVKEGGKKKYISRSPELHAYTGNGTKKYTNVKAVKVAKKAVTLRKGRTFRIKAKLIKINKKKKFMTKDHAPKLRYLSMNKKIATVTKGGKIKAIKKGTCYVYVYAHNGVNKKVKVTVK